MPNQALAPGAEAFFDSLRFVLATVVVIGHGFGYFFGYFGEFFPSSFPYLQSIAVVGFFFVSGFLISKSVMIKWNRNGFGFGSYLVDRFARVYCTLIPCLLLVLGIDSGLLRLYPGYEFSSSLSFPVFANNLLLIPGLPLGSIRPIWSLMFEWWIYILFGGLIFLYKNKVLGTAAIFFGAYYTFFVNGKGDGGQLGLVWAGGAISAVYFERICRAKFNNSLLATFFLVSAAAAYAVTLNAYNLYAGALLCAGLLLVAVHKNKARPLSPGRMATYRFLAGYSFTLFLTHYTVLYWFWIVGYRGLEGFLLAILAANLIAIVVARYTEQHHKTVSRWIMRSLFPSRAVTAGETVFISGVRGRK